MKTFRNLLLLLFLFGDPIITMNSVGIFFNATLVLYRQFINDQLSQKFDSNFSRTDALYEVRTNAKIQYSLFRYNWPRVEDSVLGGPVLGFPLTLLQSYQSA